MKNKITTIRIQETTKKKFKAIKKYPRETDNETLINLIKGATQ